MAQSSVTRNVALGKTNDDSDMYAVWLALRQEDPETYDK